MTPEKKKDFIAAGLVALMMSPLWIMLFGLGGLYICFLHAVFSGLIGSRKQ